ncbi:hypothetical protein PLESTM_001571300 [Pleodorina starrii]|nr:hypothetical protein PLESTM_001571300 [Pleodorina starrii]
MVAGRFQRASAGSGVVASATSSAQPSEAQSLDMHNFNFTEEEARNLRRFWDAELYRLSGRVWVAAIAAIAHASVLSRLRVLVTADGTGGLALLLARCWLVG